MIALVILNKIVRIKMKNNIEIENNDDFEMGFIQGIAKVENILRERRDFSALRTIKNVFNGIDKMINDSDDFVKYVRSPENADA